MASSFSYPYLILCAESSNNLQRVRSGYSLRRETRQHSGNKIVLSRAGTELVYAPFRQGEESNGITQVTYRAIC